MYRVLTLLTALSVASAQLTAQINVASTLLECYSNVTLLNRNNLPPTSIQVLIDIIQKIEDNPSVAVSLRELAVALLHTYRQDGIIYKDTPSTNPNVLPYSPNFHSFYRHRLLLTRLIQNNNRLQFDDTVLNSELKCAIHNMLSTSVDTRVRGDEGMCNNLSQYRALRVPRSAGSGDDVEILDSSFLEKAKKNRRFVEYNPKDDAESTGYYGSPSEKQIASTSQCPILTGAINTQYGALSAGNLIAGIAAGTESQSVPVADLFKGAQLTHTDLSPSVSPLYPATLSGDLAEAALIQGTERGAGTSISVGVAGGWNSTQARKHYLLQSTTNLEMTDSEMRGDIDGFILGNFIRANTVNMRLSQLLDMYYAPRNGIFNPELRACNRRQLLDIDTNTLTEQTYTFAAALNTAIPLSGTLVTGLRELVVSAISNFQQYSNNDLPNLSCATVENGNPNFRTRTNLYLALDSSWPYETIYPAISYLLDMIEVGKYGSSVTLLNAFNGAIIVNTTFSLADFHTQYTLAVHQSILPSGVNLENSLMSIRTLMLAELDREQRISYNGGNSTVLLYLINSGMETNERIWNEARLLNDTVPDLRILFATSGNQQDSLWNLVRDMHQDINTISLTSTGTNVDQAMNTVLERIRTAGRRIVNPNCGSEWASNVLSGTRQFTDHIEPGYVNYYSVSANYFYRDNQNTKIRITRTGSGVGTFMVCFSRVVEQPRANSSTSINVDANVVHCEQISTMSGSIEFSLNDACGSYSTINTCPRLFISVESVVSGATTTSNICTENACRFPYNIRYNVQYEDFGCFSGSTSIAANFVVISLAIVSLLRLI